MESEMSTTGPSMTTKSDDNAFAEQRSSSPQSSNSSNDKSNESFSLSSDADAGDDSLLRHPKGKRKRTAAKDKSILESAYLANPKPDKTARLSIVSQVSLNEKEVQIWFQNRRQNDRRKSRPLSPQEIAALRYGGMHALSSDPPPLFAHSSLSQHSSFSSDGASSSPPHQFTSASMMPIKPSTTPASSPEIGPWMPDAFARKLSDERQTQTLEVARDRNAMSEGEDGKVTAAHTLPAQHSFSTSIGSVGYLANRWNMHSSFSTPSSLAAIDDAAASDSSRDMSVMQTFVHSSATVLPPPLQRQQTPQQQSHQRPFRLCLSLDGKAEVMPSQSPSPPRRLSPPQLTVPVERRAGSSSSSNDSPLSSLPAIRRSGLSRSHSAVPHMPGLTLPPISSLTNSLASGSAPPLLPLQPSHPPRLLRGRSRDVQAWESVCDADTRVDDELSAHAENEASGSAIAAISLLRSTSSASSTGSPLSSAVLQPNGSKRNYLSRPGAPRPGAKRAKLGRALSSVARMQHVSNPREAWQESGKDKVWIDDEKKKKLKMSTLLSGNDSDKENWSPGNKDRSVPYQQRRPLPSSKIVRQQRPALGSGGKNSNAQLASRSIAGQGSFDGLEIYEDSAIERKTTPLKRIQLSRAATLPAVVDVERFMHGTNVSPSKRGDMDCVAGLLSLSQGNWR